MVVLEIILMVVVLISGLFFFYRREDILFRYIITGVSVIVGIIHRILFPFRWQVYPVYLLLVIIFLVNVGTLKRNVKLKHPIIIGIIGLLFLCTTSVTLIAFPIEELPNPSGTYPIGTTTFIIDDVNRDEVYTTETDFRRFKIQLWYPAETIEGYEQAKWIDDGLILSRALAIDFGFPSFLLNQITLVDSHSYINAPIQGGMEYPVVVLSHGWGGFRNLHTDFAEELASNGYIVVGIEHTYGSVATVFDEEDIIYGYDDALPPRETTENFLEYANTLVLSYAGDIITTLDFLESLNSGIVASDFEGLFDLSKIGVVGHSTGGGATVYAAINDDRIDALIGLDAWVEPLTESSLSNGLDIPALYLRSEEWETGYNNEDLYYFLNQSSNAVLYQIEGTTHFDFALVHMYSPLVKLIGFSGPIDSEVLTDMLSDITLQYFDDTLKDESLPKVAYSKYDELEIIETE